MRASAASDDRGGPAVGAPHKAQHFLGDVAVPRRRSFACVVDDLHQTSLDLCASLRQPSNGSLRNTRVSRPASAITPQKCCALDRSPLPLRSNTSGEPLRKVYCQRVTPPRRGTLTGR